MALIQVDLLCDTILQMLAFQTPVYETIIDQYHHNRIINFFLGRRAQIPASSLPSIEVEGKSSSLGWHACRVQQDEPSVELDITTDNSDPESAVRLQAALVTVTVRILNAPPNLRPLIKGTRNYLYDSLATNVTYGTVGQGRMRVATLTWSGKVLEFMSNRLFDPQLQIPGLSFPPV